MDSLNHLIFAVLLITPFGFCSYRFALKIVGAYAASVAVGYLAFGLSMNFVYFTDLVAYLIILYMLYLAWTGRRPYLKLFMFSAATVIVAGQSHGADHLLGFFAEVPSMTSPLRPHNFWHSPLVALLLSALTALLLPRLLNALRGIPERLASVELEEFKPDFMPILSITYLGYLFHVFADSITYDFDVWWLFPFSDLHFSIYELGDTGKLLATDPGNPWGWVYYYLTPALVALAAIYLGLGYMSGEGPVDPRGEDDSR